MLQERFKDQVQNIRSLYVRNESEFGDDLVTNKHGLLELRSSALKDLHMRKCREEGRALVEEF